MTTKTNIAKTRPTPLPRSLFDLPLPFGQNEHLLNIGLKAQMDGIERMRLLGESQLAFLGHRLGRDVELWSDLAAMKEPTQAATVWSDYIVDAQQDYRAQLERVTRMLLDDMLKASDELQEVSSEVQQQVGKQAKTTARQATV